MNKFSYGFFLAVFFCNNIFGQYEPKNIRERDRKNAMEWVNSTYDRLSQQEKLGQLFIVALYTNKDENHIEQVRQLVHNEQIGGLILMQDDAAREILLVNEFQQKSKVPMMIGMDAEWGVFQRIPKAYKYPWAMTLGAIQDKNLIYEMAAKIAEDCKKMGINWNFAPVVDVNTNPNNPIIGNRSFGSQVPNVIASALEYSKGLQDNQILAAIKHFPGHGDTNTDSHLDLPVVSHDLARLTEVELAPFQSLMNKGIGGVMVAHLYVPTLENKTGVPASVSKSIVTDLLKNKMGYKGLIITDALNMSAVAKRYQPGELDAFAFAAGNDIMLFSQGVVEGKRLIQNAIDNGEIPQSRVEESVKKILLTKYYLGLNKYEPKTTENIVKNLNNDSHRALMQKLYANALTLIKDQQKLLPLKKQEKYYYLPLEEAPYDTYWQELSQEKNIQLIQPDALPMLPTGSTIIIGLHKDNSTAYKPYKISERSKKILAQAAKNNKIILNVFGSPYSLRDLSLEGISTVLVSYENNADAMTATARAMYGKTAITGKLPVLVNAALKPQMGIRLSYTSSTCH